jgi:hypothetical protein
METQTRRDFVVYAFLREEDDQYGEKGSFYYIGKGTPSRPRVCSSRKGAKCPKNRKNNIVILYDKLDEKSAYSIEIELIAKYKRIDLDPENGILLNKTNGGMGMTCAVASPENIPKGEKHWNYKGRNWCHIKYGFFRNKSISDLIKLFPEEKLNESHLGELFTKSESCKTHKGWIPVVLKPEQESMSDDELGKIYTTEYAKTTIERLKKERYNKNKGENSSFFGKFGELHPAYGYRHSEESLKKISIASKEFAKKRNWEHPIHGIVLNKSPRMLSEMFPELNLISKSLYRVINGTRNHYKGWKYVGNT